MQVVAVYLHHTIEYILLKLHLMIMMHGNRKLVVDDPNQENLLFRHANAKFAIGIRHWNSKCESQKSQFEIREFEIGLRKFEILKFEIRTRNPKFEIDIRKFEI